MVLRLSPSRGRARQRAHERDRHEHDRLGRTHVHGCSVALTMQARRVLMSHLTHSPREQGIGTLSPGGCGHPALRSTRAPKQRRRTRLTCSAAQFGIQVSAAVSMAPGRSRPCASPSPFDYSRSPQCAALATRGGAKPYSGERRVSLPHRRTFAGRHSSPQAERSAKRGAQPGGRSASCSVTPEAPRLALAPIRQRPHSHALSAGATSARAGIGLRADEPPMRRAAAIHCPAPPQNWCTRAAAEQPLKLRTARETFSHAVQQAHP